MSRRYQMLIIMHVLQKRVRISQNIRKRLYINMDEKVFKVSCDENIIGFVQRGGEFLKEKLSNARKDMLLEIDELMPPSFRFMMKNMPISSKQEERINLEQVAQQNNDEYTIYIQKCTVAGSTPLQSATPMTEARTGTITTHFGNVAKVSKPFENTQLEAQRAVETLEEELHMARAQLESLQEEPPLRPWHGRSNFTCTNCHYKGHKVSKPCLMPPCRGYNECGVLSMHPEHKTEINKAKQRIKSFEKKFKEKKDELDSLELIKGRTLANFFSIMRPRLITTNPIKYSSRQSLENDLRILAAACKHIVPGDNVDLEDMIIEHKQKSKQKSKPPYQKERNDRGSQWRKSLQSDHYSYNRSPKQYSSRSNQHSFSRSSSPKSNSPSRSYGSPFCNTSPLTIRFSPYRSPLTSTPKRHVPANLSNHSQDLSETMFSTRQTARREVCYSSREVTDSSQY